MRTSQKILMILKILLRSIMALALLILTNFIIATWHDVNNSFTLLKNEATSLVNDSDLNTFRAEETSHIYDLDGNLLVKLKGNRDTIYLKYEDIPTDVVNAFIAVEDRNFWSHNGIDLKGITRILYRFVITSGSEKHGASTITQQLARNIFLNHDVTIQRKLKEIFLSFELESKYSKEDIMEYYVNNIYFGHQCYGIESAANYYFGKNVNNCSLSEIAFLCAIPNNPTLFDPIKSYDNTISRQRKIIADMEECGFISQKTANSSLDEKVVLNIQHNNFYNYETTYAIECAIRYLMRYVYSFKPVYSFSTYKAYEEYMTEYNEIYEKAKKELKTGGYTIHTSIDRNIQKQLQEDIDNTLDFSSETKGSDNVYALQGAATCIDNKTGKVLAIVGGRTQESSVYTLNRAYQSTRQPGSSIKPFLVYSPAFELGYDPDTIVLDKKIIDGPKNSGNNYSGEIKLRTAIAKSKNVVAWNLYKEITPATGITYLQKMQFKKIVPDDYYMPACLGGLTYGVTTEEMSAAYATLVNNGIYKEPTCLISIINADGKEIYSENKPTEVYSALSSQQMVDCLVSVVESGTAFKLYWNEEIPAAGKTGTTNNNTDGWFCGMTPYYTISVWVGYDDSRSMRNLQGSSYPLEIWGKTMRKLILNKDNCQFDFSEIENRNEIQGHLNDSKSHDFSWLNGKSDFDVLINNYTVLDYKEDHELAQLLDTLISRMKAAKSIEVLEQNHEIFLEKTNYFVSGKMKSDYTSDGNKVYKKSKKYLQIKAKKEKEKEKEDNLIKEELPATTPGDVSN